MIRRNIFFKVSKIAALLLYIPFFLVQIFLNHDNVVAASNINVQSYNKTDSSNHLIVSNNHTEKRTGKTVNIRLNKRFQPATIPFFEPISFERPVYNCGVKLFGNYLNPVLPSFYLLAKILRGPPATA